MRSEWPACSVLLEFPRIAAALVGVSRERNVIILVLEAKGIKTENKVQLGTTKIVRGAISAGEIDIYPEYTGTIAQEILPRIDANRVRDSAKISEDDLRHALESRGVRMSRSCASPPDRVVRGVRRRRLSCLDQ